VKPRVCPASLAEQPLQQRENARRRCNRRLNKNNNSTVTILIPFAVRPVSRPGFLVGFCIYKRPPSDVALTCLWTLYASTMLHFQCSPKTKSASQTDGKPKRLLHNSNAKSVVQVRLCGALLMHFFTMYAGFRCFVASISQVLLDINICHCRGLVNPRQPSVSAIKMRSSAD
jgi:hypothetical protein